MRKIDYGINAYYKTAKIYVEYASLWIFALDRISEFFCDLLFKIPQIKLPKFKIVRDGEKTTFGEYYGDLQDLIHVCVHCWISDYCTRHTSFRFINVDYNEAKKAFYDKEKRFWDEMESDIESVVKDDKENT